MRDRLLASAIKNTEQHVLLLGPRQVGKSTLVKSLCPDLYINFADESEFLAHSRNPRRLTDQIRSLTRRSLVVVDEIQRVVPLLNSIQALIDDNPFKHRLILTGSSARKLRRGGANLLPGRVIILRMNPLLVSELDAEFELDRALQSGMLPGIYLADASVKQELLGSYANIYLREEIQAEGVLKNLGSFSRLLDMIAVVSGSWLNYSKLSSDTEIPKETVRRYVSILEDTLVLHRLPAFRPKLKLSRKPSQRDKVLLFDVGVRNALLGLHSIPTPQNQIGPIFEQWLIQQIIGISTTCRKNWTISSFLTESDLEIDVVIETPTRIIAVEIKAARTLHDRRFRAFDALERVVRGYKPIEKFVFCLVDQEELLPGAVRVLSYREGLRLLQDMID